MLCGTMASPLALVTGAAGLIGSTVCRHFSRLGLEVAGVDNNQRAVFFGPRGDTSWVLNELQASIPGYTHHDLDIRNREAMLALVRRLKPAVIIHTAAQPSHDLAASIPFDDFEINATGTLNLLEAARRACPESPFVHMSTNKVYGDRPNTIALRELDTRWDYADAAYANGIPESFPIDQSTHSLFGASKVAADVMVQEYGRYFGMPTCCLRAGCLTGPNHAGVELHGFLSYVVRCNLEGIEYKIFGYQGKQVRDNIHAEDVARMMEEFYRNPRCGEVYNLGGGRGNTCSVLESFQMVAEITGKPQRHTYVEEHRTGDHICYYSDLSKLYSHYPDWSITKPLPTILEEIVAAWTARRAARSVSPQPSATSS